MTVSPSGRVVGDIRAPTVLIHGRVDGTVYSLDQLEIADGAIIQGDRITAFCRCIWVRLSKDD